MHEKVRHWVFVVRLDALCHFLCKSRKSHSYHEVILDLQPRDSAIVLAMDRCRASAVQDCGYFSEHSAGLDRGDEQGNGRGENLEDVAVATDQKEHLVRVLALHSDLLVRLIEIEGKFLEDCRGYPLIEPEHRLAFDDSVEFMLNYARLDRWTEKLHESRELLLAFQTRLVCNDVVSDFVFQRPW